MSYLVKNISGKVQSFPKTVDDTFINPPVNNWAIGQVDTVSDDQIYLYNTRTDVFTVLSGPSNYNFPNYALNANTATAGATLTAANITGGANEVILNMTGTITGGANAQLPTVANLVAAIPNANIGMTYKLVLANVGAGAFAWTVTTNTGWTLTGTMSVAQTTTRTFLVTLTSLTAATLISIATGTP